MPPLERITLVRERSRVRMRRQIIDAAEQFSTHQGVGRLSIDEVGRLAGVGRGTVYRHFPTRESLLAALASREARHLLERVMESLKPRPGAPTPLDTLIRHATWIVREHGILRDMLESDPGFVLQSLRQNYGTLRESIGKLITPWLAEHGAENEGRLPDEQIVDALTRLMISHFLFPEAHPERAAHDLAEVCDHLVGWPSASTS